MHTSRRVVIVYERAGQGHLAAAEALGSILQAEPDVEVVLKDGEELERDGGGENPLIALWNFLIKRGWFRLADLILNHWFRVAIFPLLSVSATLPRVKSRLKALRPDAIISTADAFNRALGDAANEIGIPFTVCRSSSHLRGRDAPGRELSRIFRGDRPRDPSIRSQPPLSMVIRDNATARRSWRISSSDSPPTACDARSRSSSREPAARLSEHPSVSCSALATSPMTPQQRNLVE